MSSNPAFSRSAAFRPGQVSRDQLENLYGRGANTAPAADTLEAAYDMPAATGAETGRMTYEDTIVKTLVSFAVLVAGAAIGWVIPALMLPGLIIAFVLAMVNIFKKTPSPALVLAYAAFEGIALGALSMFFNSMYDGIVTQAIVGTLAVVGVTLFLFLSGKFRATPRMNKIVTMAIIGYAVFSLVNMILMMTGAMPGMTWGMRSLEIAGIPLGLILGVVVVFLAAYSLVMDFESIKVGVERGAPRVYAWQGAFGIMVTVVWLYTEILRMLAITRE
mgnify:FL=1